VLAVQNAVDRRDIGIATASANLFRALGGSVGVAVFGTLFASRLDAWLPRELPATAGRIDADSIQASPAALHSLPAATQDGIAESVAHSLHTVFLVAVPVALAGLAVVLFLREVPLRGPGDAGNEKTKKGGGNGHHERAEQAGDAPDPLRAVREGESRRGGRVGSSPVREPRSATRKSARSGGPEGDDQLVAGPVGADAGRDLG
jgi:hypothetical protein